MKQKLTLIASAASLILLGVPANCNAFQQPIDSPIGSGLVSGIGAQKSESMGGVLTPLVLPKVGSWQANFLQGTAANKSSEIVFPSVVQASAQEAIVPRNNATYNGVQSANGSFSLPPIVKTGEYRVARLKSTEPVAQNQMPSPGTVLGIDSVVKVSPADQYVPSASVMQNAGVTDFSISQSTDAQTPNYFMGHSSTGEAPVISDGGCQTCGPIVSSDGLCATCGTGMSDGACPSCGPGAGFSDGPVIDDCGTFGSVSASRAYMHAEALYMTREDGDIFGGNIAPLTNFDYAPGLRLTLGRKQDSVFGKEIGVTILRDISQDVTVRNSPVLNVDFQSQHKESDLYSVEFNRVSWGWDLVKTFAGFRFMRFDDSYRIAAETAARGSTPAVVDVFGNTIRAATSGRPAGSGLTTIDASNSLFGFHVGGELFYDIGYRWSTSIGTKLGAYANLNDYDTNTFLNSAAPFSAENEGATLSTSAELSVLAHYQIRSNLRFKVGYNLMFIDNLATVSDNAIQQFPTLTGVNSSDSDSVLFHGLSVGLEFYR